MMEKLERLERLGRRLLPHPEEGGEQSKPAKGLRWYYKAFVVPALAIAIFGASLTIPDRAQANHIGYWGQCVLSYGTFGYATCWNVQDHATGNYYGEGWGYWDSSGAFRYMPLNDNCHYLLWIGDRWTGWWTEDYCRSFL
jgi:hypothetical protein